ncbi:MAG: Rrf2 family transcriptional regulator [Firmicutes bacterium]|nr:Rrf2 family transcriptional regulator [Bacillota bacterium]
MEITKKTEYAISALIELAQNPGEYISSKEIAHRQEIPVNFLPQIIALLGTEGWVEGVRGPGGGVRLLVDPNSISVKDVIELIEGRVAISRCLTNELGCSRLGRCPLHSVWQEAQTALMGVLGRITIARLTEQEKALTSASEAD